MRRLIFHLFVVIFVVGLSGASFGVSGDDDWKWIFQRVEKKWQPQFELTGRAGNNELYGMEIDPLIPIVQNNKSMVFLNVRNLLAWDHSEFGHELNAGAGYRRIMGDNSYILGVYGYYDRMESRYDNYFNQGTLGLEALAVNWDFRLNGYIADDDTKTATGAGRASASLVGTSLRIDTTVEQAMSGLDAEAGWRLPFFGDEGVLSDTRVYAGGFWFDGDVVDAIAGPMTRFETRIWEVPFLPGGSRLTLGTEYRWDDERDHQVTGTLAIRIPLGATSAASKSLNRLERRMTDRVVRDVSIVSNRDGRNERVKTRTGAVIEETYFFEDDGGVLPEPPVGTPTVGLADTADGSFEDPFNIYAAVETGENNLLIGLSHSGDIDLWDGPVSLQDGQTLLGGGTQLMVWGEDSGQMAIFTAPGGPGSAATICCMGLVGAATSLAGGLAAQGDEAAIYLAANNTIAGLHFEGVARALELEVNDDESTMVDIYNNHFAMLGSDLQGGDLNFDGFEGTAIEIDVEDEATLTAYIEDNWFELMNTGVDVWAEDSFNLTLEVNGNEFANMDKGLELDLEPTGEYGPSVFSMNAHENNFLELEYGIDTDVYIEDDDVGADYTHTEDIRGNTFYDSEEDDYRLDIEGYDGTPPAGDIDIDVTLAGNRSYRADKFANIDVDPVPFGEVNLTIVDNEVLDADDGIDIKIEYGPDVIATISRNTIRHTENPLVVEIMGSGDEDGHTLTLRENLIEDAGDDGIDIEIDGGLNADVTIADNTLRDIGDSSWNNGIEVEFYKVGDGDGTNEIAISGNTLEFVDGDDAIDVKVEYSDDTDITISNNNIYFSDEDGIDVDIMDTGHDLGNSLTITRNTINFSEQADGIDVVLEDLTAASEVTTVTIADNDVFHSEDNGIELNLNTVDNAVVTIEDNLIEDSGDDSGDGNGIMINIDPSNDNEITIASNEIVRTDDDAIEIRVDGDEFDGDSSGNIIVIENNEVALTGDDGFDIKLDSFSSGNTLEISGNVLDIIGEEGIEVQSNSSVTLDSKANNTVTNVAEDDVSIEGTGPFIGQLEVNGVDVPVP